jgi:long-chain acyl-CoA synthetase
MSFNLAIMLRESATSLPDADQTADDIRSWVKERIAPYKYPREVLLVDVLPKGPTGKILKQTLKNSTGRS